MNKFDFAYFERGMDGDFIVLPMYETEFCPYSGHNFVFGGWWHPQWGVKRLSDKLDLKQILPDGKIRNPEADAQVADFCQLLNEIAEKLQ